MPHLSDFNMTRKETKLSSGVKVVLYGRPSMPVTLKVSFMAGGGYDPKGYAGISHFAEHMLVAGTKKFPSKDKMANYIERVGGQFGARTGREFQELDLFLAEAEDIDVATELINAMQNESLLTDQLIETERGSIMQEIDNRDSQPGMMAAVEFHSLSNAGTSFEPRLIGMPEIVARITRRDIQKQFAKIYATNRMTIIAAGGIELDQLVGSLEKNLKPTENFNTPEALVYEGANPSKKRIVTSPFDVNDQIHFVVGVPIPGFLDRDSSALSLIGTIIGGGRASVLQRILRYEKGLVYSTGAGPIQISKRGSWVVHGSCNKSKLEEVMGVINNELNRVGEGGITKDELSFAKNKRIKSIKIGLQTSGQWTSIHQHQEAFNTGRTITDEIEDISRLTLDDLTRVGKKYFTHGSMVGSFAGRITENEVPNLY